MTAKKRTKAKARTTAAPAGVEFFADTRPAKDAVVGGLTHDANIDECIFDLIDNSIDAARNDMLSKATTPDIDEFEIPDRYDGYRVELKVSKRKLSISDNCGGIDASHIKNVALRFGKRSNHPYGIGTYGVGLNRAIFRLGKKAVMDTYDGSDSYRLEIDSDEYISSDSWDVPVKRILKAGDYPGTSISINLLSGVAVEMSSTGWLSKLAEKAEWRYGHILDKGLEIKIGNVLLTPKYINFRKDSPFSTRKKSYVDDGVYVSIEVGEHHQHRFKREKGWTDRKARQLTQEYGWNITCNDRTILIADRSTSTGWPTVWHPEFYGFVGHVSFVSIDPEKLPWNSKKTGLDSTHPIFLNAVETMRLFAKEWRTYAKKAAKGAGDNASGSNGGKTGNGKKSNAKPSSDKSGSDHTQYTTVLPPDINECSCEDKILRMVREAKALDMKQNIYSGILLLRTLFEISAIHFLKRKKRFSDFRDYLFEKKNTERKKAKKSPLPGEFKLHYSPEFEEICEYFIRHGDVWGKDDFSYAKSSLEKARKYRKLMNGVAHSPTEIVNVGEAIMVRDATVPLLRHLLG